MDIKKKITLLSYILIASTLLCSVVLAFAFMWCFNSGDGYFVRSAPPIVFSVIYFSGIVLSLVATLLIDKKNVIKTENELGKLQIPYIVLAIALLACILVGVLKFTDKLFTLSILGVFTLAIYIIICAAKDGYRGNSIKILLVYVSALFPVAVMISNNSNYIRHLNSVENILFAVFGMSFMTYILYEAKRIHEGVHSRWHLFSMLITIHTGFSFSVAYIAAYLRKSVDEPNRLYQMILVLIISVIVGLELLRFITKAEYRTQEEWDEIEKPIDECDNNPAPQDNNDT